MEQRKVFTCQKCDTEIEVEDARNQDEVACHACGTNYRLRFSDLEQAWVMVPTEPIEPGTDQERAEEPFRVLNEVGRLKRQDRSEEYREQKDIHEDEDIATDEPQQKP